MCNDKDLTCLRIPVTFLPECPTNLPPAPELAPIPVPPAAIAAPAAGQTSNGQPAAPAGPPGQAQGSAVPPATNTSSSNDSSSDGGSNTAAIVGGVVGGVVGLLLLLTAGLFIFSRQRRKRREGAFGVNGASADPKPSLRPFMSEEEERAALEDGHMFSPFDQGGWQWSGRQTPQGSAGGIAAAPAGAAMGGGGAALFPNSSAARKNSLPGKFTKGSNASPLASLLSNLRSSTTVLGSEESSALGSPTPPAADGIGGIGSPRTLGGVSGAGVGGNSSLETIQDEENSLKIAGAAPGNPPWNDWEVGLNGKKTVLKWFYIHFESFHGCLGQVNRMHSSYCFLS